MKEMEAPKRTSNTFTFNTVAFKYGADFLQSKLK